MIDDLISKKNENIYDNDEDSRGSTVQNQNDIRMNKVREDDNGMDMDEEEADSDTEDDDQEEGEEEDDEDTDKEGGQEEDEGDENAEEAEVTKRARKKRRMGQFYLTTTF